MSNKVFNDKFMVRKYIRVYGPQDTPYGGICIYNIVVFYNQDGTIIYESNAT